MNYHAAKAFILHKLSQDLSPKLTYHGIHHTFDVLEVVSNLCKAEQISVYESMLLKTAVLFHDSGFIFSSEGHEARSCGLAKAHLPQYNYTAEEIERICGMIMATKIPQTPNNILEEIICDADLDYLGRPDFKSIAKSLFVELKNYEILQKEEDWNRIQVTFIGNHSFFTRTNREQRRPPKLAHLAELKSLVATYSSS